MRPNFLIIGPPKCGTTALYVTLAQHPQVFMSQVKEPYFFAFDGQPPTFVGPDADYYHRQAVTKWEAYQSLFAEADGYVACGEASPLYLTNYQPERTAANIRRRLPDMHLIAILRQPTDRAYSQFSFRRQLGFEPLTDFRDALAAEDQRLAANWPPGCRYWRNGLYFTNLTPYYALFPRTQIRVYLYDDLLNRPASMLNDLCQFLCIDPSLMPNTVVRRNVTIWPRSQVLSLLLRHAGRYRALLPTYLRRTLGHHLRAWNQTKPPPIDPGLRCELSKSYRDEIMRLQDLIARDLGHWVAKL
ncbi:sulfotransferase [Candidatus Chloroploca sp. Khr17]|uniref:sulfotransferase family protein n=1 Tax=Candidatus Chloroploca sp. Khr17 TaxID=2496869 RepID=UPI00101D0A63|nr:sulfotransferase [Candidatus Chloroploca sp. Khr17]